MRKCSRKSVRAVCWPCPARPDIIVGLWRALASLSIELDVTPKILIGIASLSNEFQCPNLPNTCWAITYLDQPNLLKIKMKTRCFQVKLGVCDKPDVLRQPAAKRNTGAENRFPGRPQTHFKKYCASKVRVRYVFGKPCVLVKPRVSSPK